MIRSHFWFFLALFSNTIETYGEFPELRNIQNSIRTGYDGIQFPAGQEVAKNFRSTFTEPKLFSKKNKWITPKDRIYT